MAYIVTAAQWGLSCTCTGGTAVPAVLIPKGTQIPIQALCFSGSASTDLITVQDGDGTLVHKSAGGLAVVLNGARLDGLKVGSTGGTNGAVSIIYKS